VQLSCILCSCARHLLSTDILNVTISGKRQACTLSTSLSYIAMNLACVASCLFAYSPASNDQTSVRYQRTSKTFSCALASRDRSCLSQRQILPFTETDPAFHRDRSCLSQRQILPFTEGCLANTLHNTSRIIFDAGGISGQQPLHYLGCQTCLHISNLRQVLQKDILIWNKCSARRAPLCSHFTEQDANPRAAAQRAAAAAPCQRECVFRVSQQACCIGLPNVCRSKRTHS